MDETVENLTAGLWGLVGKAGSTVGSLAKKVQVASKEVATEFKETIQARRSFSSVLFPPLPCSPSSAALSFPLPPHLGLPSIIIASHPRVCVCVCVSQGVGGMTELCSFH
jgi:hypothetical protein